MYNEYATYSCPVKSSPDCSLFGGSWGVLLFPFIVGLMTLSRMAGLSKIVILYGVLVTGMFSVYFIYRKLTLLPEVIIYFVWVIWSLSGLFIAIDKELYSAKLLTVIQSGFLLFLISGIISLRKNISMVMLAIIVGGLIVLLSSFYTGEFSEAGESGTRTRAAGITGNANGFAYTLMFTVYAVFYFWDRKHEIVWRITLACILALSALGIVFSGSRTGMIGFLAFLLFWWVFCSRKRLQKHPIKLYLIVIAFSFVMYRFIDYVFSSTLLGHRMQHFQSTSNQLRWEFYLDGLDMLMHNLIFGVGLDNFRVVSGQYTYSHSNYIEIASTTGIVGALLFYSIFLLVWRRLSRIKKIYKEPQCIYTIGLFKAAILTILIQSFSTVNYYSKVSWLFLAAVIGYTWSLEKTLSRAICLHRVSRKSGQRAENGDGERY